jgi:hypothetical protein
LIPYTLPEVLRLVWSLAWQQVETVVQVLSWSFFRRHHQAAAQICHYQQRLTHNTS